jgi:hypothetical protein
MNEDFYQQGGQAPLDFDSNTANYTAKSNKQVVYKQVAQRVILSSMGNINLVHEIIRSVIYS